MSASLSLRVNVRSAEREEVLGELLGQGASTLHGMPGAQVGPSRARNRQRVDADVFVEPAILDLEQYREERGWDVIEPQQHTILAVLGVDPSDLRPDRPAPARVPRRRPRRR